MNVTTLILLLAEIFRPGYPPYCSTQVIADGLMLDHTVVVVCAPGDSTRGWLWFLESGETWDTRAIPLSQSQPVATTDAHCTTTWEHVYAQDGTPRHSTPLVGTTRVGDLIYIISRTSTYQGSIGECQSSFNNAPLPSFSDGERVLILGDRP